MDYRNLVKKSLNELKSNAKKLISESIKYMEGHNERMHPKLEQELKDRKHSLGEHPIFPEGDEMTFEQRIVGDRFSEVLLNLKEKLDCDDINDSDIKMMQQPLVQDCMMMEDSHKKELEALAVKMIRDEYNISEDVVEINVELTDDIDITGTKKEPLPITVDIDFENHQEIRLATDYVYKRRFLNAMTQGAAKKSSHMFHMVSRELSEMNPRLLPKYSKLMAVADYTYFIVPNMSDISTINDDGIGQSVTGGIVRVTLPTEQSPKCVIDVQAMVFPVLIHELVKGVMEILSAHGLPDDDEMAKYVIGKADFLAAEPWDMVLGPALWEKFTTLIDVKDFDIKHNIYSKLVGLPINEFNSNMREIMAGTKLGKDIITNLSKECNDSIKDDNFRDEIGDDDSEGFSLNDIDGIDLNDLI